MPMGSLCVTLELFYITVRTFTLYNVRLNV